VQATENITIFHPLLALLQERSHHWQLHQLFDADRVEIR